MPCRPAACRQPLGLLVSLLPAAALAAPATPTRLDPRVFPPAETFRTLQLAVLACSRENTAASCEQARQLADPLLDHPRLPSGCKDVLWSVRQSAQPGGADDFARRDRIDRQARELPKVCRMLGEPKQEKADPGQGGAPAGVPGGGMPPGGAPPR